MESSNKLSALFFISLFLVSSAAPIDLDCGPCDKPKPPTGKPPHVKPPPKLPPHVKPPPKLPPHVKPPFVKPPIVKPPVTIPPVKPPIDLPIPPVKPPVDLPIPPVKPPIDLPIPPVKPPVDLPPVGIPPIKPPIDLPIPPVKPPIDIPVVTPPVVTPPEGKPCPPPTTTPVPPPMGSGSAPPAKCPIDTLKLGACVDLLGGLVHIGLGDPNENKCCALISGLADVEAAVCLCTTLKVNLLNLNIYLPIALQLLATCGKSPPPGFTCSI